MGFTIITTTPYPLLALVIYIILLVPVDGFFFVYWFGFFVVFCFVFLQPLVRVCRN